MIHHGNCLEILPTLDADSIDSCVTDPPYGLSFMGKDWDHGVPGEHFWREVLRVLKPGAHLLAFGGTRTFHRLTCAIEDAGFEIRDCLMWLYGSGFPKSHNLGTGWGTALKPAWEPIILARKPLIGTVAANVARYGTGAVNVDGCRVQWQSKEDAAAAAAAIGYATSMERGTVAAPTSLPTNYVKPPYEPHTLSGRWPANLILDEEAGAMLDEQTGTLTSGRLGIGHGSGNAFGIGNTDKRPRPISAEYGNDSGGASRFFYCAKASRSERNAGLDGDTCTHPTVKPLSLMRYLCRLVTPPGGTVLDPFMGSGSTGCGAVQDGFDFIGCELSAEYVEIAEKRVAHWAAKMEEKLF